jgi:hypothetical protein
MTTDAKRLLLVVGIGRSGTSLFTGILSRLGFRVPQPEVRADDTNPRGFSEPRWVVDFHTRLLRERRVTLYDSRPDAWLRTAEAASDQAVFKELKSWLAVQLVGAENIVIKDPRVGWFLPLWSRCAAELGVETSFATLLRYPPEVLESARRWYGTWQNDASRAAAWLNHTLQTEQATREAPRAFVRYEALLEDWPRELSRVGEALGLPGLVGIDPQAHPEVDALVDPGLRRSTVGWEEVRVPSALQVMAEEVWGQVTALATPGGDSEGTRASLDAARAAYAELYAEAEAVAQSSVTAARPRAGGLEAALSGRAGAPRIASKRELSLPLRRSRGRVKLPAGGALPARGLRFLLRMALLVPPRYRERLPMPVVRAGLRLVRALRP